jgi:hypothetical protein
MLWLMNHEHSLVLLVVLCYHSICVFETKNKKEKTCILVKILRLKNIQSATIMGFPCR